MRREWETSIAYPEENIDFAGHQRVLFPSQGDILHREQRRPVRGATRRGGDCNPVFRLMSVGTLKKRYTSRKKEETAYSKKQRNAHSILHSRNKHKPIDRLLCFF